MPAQYAAETPASLLVFQDGQRAINSKGALRIPQVLENLIAKNTRELAQDKTKAVAEGLAKAQESPGILRRALLDAKSWFGSAASWVGNALGDILKGEAAQKTIGTVTEASTRATIDSFLK